MQVAVEVDVDAEDVLDAMSEKQIYQYCNDRGINNVARQQIIDIVFNNDKKTALQELESLFGGMYTGWEKV